MVGSLQRSRRQSTEKPRNRGRGTMPVGEWNSGGEWRWKVECGGEDRRGRKSVTARGMHLPATMSWKPLSSAFPESLQLLTPPSVPSFLAAPTLRSKWTVSLCRTEIIPTANPRIPRPSNFRSLNRSYDMPIHPFFSPTESLAHQSSAHSPSSEEKVGVSRHVASTSRRNVQTADKFCACALPMRSR